jgi:Tfp pilus assembly protein PilV
MLNMRAGDLLKMQQTFSNRGSTLIEIIIALGLIGMVTMGIISLSQDTLQNIQSNKLAATRDQLATQFRQSAGRIKILRFSLNKPENLEFYNCVCGQGAGCASAQPRDLVLYDPSAPNKPIDMFYDYSGLPCLETATNCTIKVTLKFVPQCAPVLPSADPTPPASCVGVPAEFFAVSFTVQQNPNAHVRSNLFKSISGSAFTQVANLAPAGSGVCP